MLPSPPPSDAPPKRRRRRSRSLRAKPDDDEAHGRALLADAGVALVQRLGFAGLTMQGLARECRVLRGSIHYQFRDKEDLELLVEDFIAVHEDRAGSPPARARSRPQEVLARCEVLLRCGRRRSDGPPGPRFDAGERLVAALRRNALHGASAEPLRAAVLAAALDGLALHALVDDTLDVEAATRLLRDALLPEERARAWRSSA